ncbi:MAG: hypothetical protein FIA95_11160 [Gemmatimonadetes bacterium]|nr:hypothetical protein [Gemmatimonadota bacterium]
MASARRRAWWPPFLITLLLVSAASGCASGGGTPTEGAAAPGVTQLSVRNTAQAGQTLQIYLQPEAGQERLLGNVAFNDVLTVPHTLGPGRYQFRAVRPDGTMLNSPLFNVVSGTYTWDVALGRVQRR